MDKLYQTIFFYGINLSFILYIFFIFGITKYAPDYLIQVKIFLKIYIGIILVLLFNPFIKKNTLNKVEKKIVFSSGIILLLSTTIFSSIEKYITSTGINIINNTKYKIL